MGEVEELSSSLVIEVEDLVKKYGSFPAVDNISFSVSGGEVFSLLGPNGAGKTTTVEILECLRRPTSGRALVMGLDVTKEKNQDQIKRKVGVMPQEFNTFEFLTVRENVEYFGRLFGVKVDADHLIRLVGLEEKADELYKNLSGGLKQKVGISTSLVNDPDLVFLDEPTAGLDPRARREIWGVIEDLKKRGKTVFLTTHYLEEAEALSDRVAIMEKGKIVALDKPDELIKRHGGQNILVVKKAAELFDRLNGELEGLKIEGDDIFIPLKNPADLSHAIGSLSALRLVDNIEIRKPNLENVFLNLTGRKLSEEGNVN